MKPRADQTPFRERLGRLLRCGVAGAILLAVAPSRVVGQSEEGTDDPLPQSPSPALPVLATPPTTVEEAQAFSEAYYGTDATAQEQQPATPEGASTRPWKLTLHGTASELYDSNIFISDRHPQADAVTTLSPGFKLAWGDWQQQQANFLTFDYTLSGILFAEHASQDTVEQEAAFDAQLAFAQLTVALQFRFEDLASPDLDVGNRTRRRLFETVLFNKYALRDQESVELNLFNRVADYETQLSSYEWSGQFWFNYAPTPKFTVGPGFVAGYLSVERSPAQNFQQALARVNYAADGKLSFGAYGGVEVRETGQGTRVEPIINVAATYRPAETTAFTLTAHRKTENSALLMGEDYVSSGVSIEASRTIHSGCDLVLGGGYDHRDYYRTNRDETLERSDDYFFARPAVRFTVARRLSIEFFYLYQEDASTRHASSFEDHQAGVRLRFDY